MAEQVKSMTPAQLKVVMKAATGLQKGARVMQRAREFIVSRWALVLALVVLMIGLVLRWTGLY